MAEKIIIEVFKTKTCDELSKSIARPDCRAEAGSAAAASASMAAALLCRASESAVDFEGLDYVKRNAEILRSYMVHLIDEDVKSRVALRKALKEGNAHEIEAARHPASAVCAEIVNMQIKMLELALQLKGHTEGHLLTECAALSVGAARCAAAYILDMSSKCADETYRYICRRENEMLLNELEQLAEKLK